MQSHQFCPLRCKERTQFAVLSSYLRMVVNLLREVWQHRCQDRSHCRQDLDEMRIQLRNKPFMGLSITCLRTVITVRRFGVHRPSAYKQSLLMSKYIDERVTLEKCVRAFITVR